MSYQQSAPFARIPRDLNSVLVQRRVSWAGMALCLQLGQNLIGKSFTSVPLSDQQLADQSGLSLKQVSNGRRCLAEKGVVDVTTATSRNGRPIQSTWTYRLRLVAEMETVVEEPELAEVGMPESETEKVLEIPKRDSEIPKRDLEIPKWDSEIPKWDFVDTSNSGRDRDSGHPLRVNSRVNSRTTTTTNSIGDIIGLALCQPDSQTDVVVGDEGNSLISQSMAVWQDCKGRLSPETYPKYSEMMTQLVAECRQLQPQVEDADLLQLFQQVFSHPCHRTAATPLWFSKNKGRNLLVELLRVPEPDPDRQAAAQSRSRAEAGRNRTRQVIAEMTEGRSQQQQQSLQKLRSILGAS